MKPIIAVTANYSFDDAIGINAHMGGLLQQWNLLAQDYISAIEDAGGIPIILPIYSDLQNAYAVLQKADGILFTGGDDINPMLYGQATISAIGSVNPLRDMQELALMTHVLTETTLPVFGICRGFQMLNIACGGTLHQDMPTAGMRNHMLASLPMALASHYVALEIGSHLQNIVGEETLAVNSYHHQCIHEVGTNLTVVAWDSDGIVEAIEHSSRSAMTFGTQWHPEGMQKQHEKQRLLFQKFIDCAKGESKW